jgi:uncharacterized membrane protein (DUF2068 family)
VRKRRDGPLILIGLFKVMKTLALLGVGVSALVELPDQLAARLEHAVMWLGLSTGRETIERAIGKLDTLPPSSARWLGVLAIAYALVFAVEGFGLLLRKSWAELVTVLVTASFIPLEIFETVRHFGVGKLVTLGLNLIIVLYLGWRLREERGGLRRLFRKRPHLKLVQPDRPLVSGRRVLSR